MSNSPSTSSAHVVSTAGGIHPTAVVAPEAHIDVTASIGPYAVIGPGVRIGPHTNVGAHAVLEGDTILGAGNSIGPHVVLGGAPQIRERPRDGCSGSLVVGDFNCFREFVTVHRGELGSATRIGHRNLLMAYSHVAHDCQLGDGIELANGAQLAGHVQVGDYVILGGLVGVHQFVRIGAYSFVGAGSMVAQDVLPYSLVSGDRARTFGLNIVGLKRHHFDPGLRQDLARALRLLLSAPTLAQAIQQAQTTVPLSEPVQRLLGFAEMAQRSFCRKAGRRKHDL